ncbi:MOSC domain-containing protein [Marinobacter psychrophilus]|jgi:MOSC domain-containing protein YiiM|uniref:MOSC domain-containing protein n=1 Tax=Marinobacter psychrophilus TaxID=330734 RepID=UPI001B48B6D7|nr:MOSC domain-containing protein [Marinobacter psychrophilus]MBQ0763730.1 MOSC domain-containing protein [Marinobacter psychrophilus]MBQ0843555.1 MOSC domain-containing protein [Marinobacter psychrophilus]
MATVLSVSKDENHKFSKNTTFDSIKLLEGLGVEGDAHSGKTVKHRSRVKVDPSQPNLRQVHLIHSELILELRASGFDVSSGSMGENILTAGIDLLSLPTGTILKIGHAASVKITGLRNPCAQLDNYQKGLTKAVLGRTEDGELIRKTGVMSIVLNTGVVKIGDPIVVELPSAPHQKLQCV